MPDVHIWVRAETYPGERRVLITPDHARGLIAGGARLSVERSDTRCFGDEEYAAAGCELVEPGSWAQAPATAYVLGIKALPEASTPLSGRHIYFAHAYKAQDGADALLARFVDGGGEVLDLEYLTDPTGRRLAAFGRWAGFVGAALALQHWHGRLETPLQPTNRPDLEAVLAGLGGDTPRVLITGARGRSGRGAAEALAAAGIVPTMWDRTETADLDTDALLQHDILVHCVGVSTPTAPFLTEDDASTPGRRLSVISDVTSDGGSPFHLLPVYEQTTSWVAPARAVEGLDPQLDVIAIDNLPSLLPREASEDFSAQLLPVLRELPQGEAWGRTKARFDAAVGTD